MDKLAMQKMEAARKIVAKLKEKEKENRDIKITTRFTKSETRLIYKYANLNQHNTIVSYIRQCIADNIRLTKNATTY